MIEAAESLQQKHTILLADDEPEIVKFFRQIFSKEGYRIVSVRNGSDVVKRAAKGDIDLAVVDIVMPGMDGIDTLRELQKVVPKLPVIVLSGYGDLNTAREAMLLGANDYITKPFDVDFMKAAIKGILRKKA